MVPPLLVSTVGLESYLQQLSRKLLQDLAKMKESVDDSALEVADAKDSVRKMMQLLCERSVEQLQVKVEEMDPVTIEENFAAMFTHDTLDNHMGEKPKDASDLVAEVIAISQRLMSENAQLKKALTESTETTKRCTQLQEEMSRQLTEMQYRMKTYHRDFHQLTLWLGVYDEKNQSIVQFSKDGTSGHKTFENLELNSASEDDTMMAASHSPLLLSFRRFLMRDLVDRVVHTAEIQNREVGTIVSSLKADVSQRVTPQRVLDIIDSRGTSDTQTLMLSFGKRLKEIENSYVRREDFTKGLRGKTDTLLTPVRDECAAVSQLEKKVNNHYADVTERLAFFEAEREEFRKIVRSLIEISQQRGTAAQPGMAAPPPTAIDYLLTDIKKMSLSQNRSSQGTGRMTRLGDLLTPMDAASQSEAAETPAPTNLDGRQLYRVLGGNRGFASPVVSKVTPAPPRTSLKSATPNPRSSLPVTGDPASKHLEGSGTPPSQELIGLTANQLAYKDRVLRNVNRDNVNSLPPLPYERKECL